MHFTSPMKDAVCECRVVDRENQSVHSPYYGIGIGSWVDAFDGRSNSLLKEDEVGRDVE